MDLVFTQQNMGTRLRMKICEAFKVSLYFIKLLIILLPSYTTLM